MAIPLNRPRLAPGPKASGPPASGLVVIGIVAGGVALLAGLAVAGTNGPVPIVVMAAIVLGLGFLRWPEAATVVFIFGLYLNIPAVATNFYGVPALVAAGMVGLLLIPLGQRLIDREPVVVAPVLPLLVVYLGVLLLSSAAALTRGLPAQFEGVELFVTEGIIVFVLVTNVVRTLPTLRHVVWALLVAGALMGALSVHQAVTQSYDSNYGGFAQVYGRALEENEDDEEDTQPRASGPVGEKNRYAQVMLVLLPLALLTLWNERRRWLKLAAGVSALLILTAVVLTFSRGAGVGLALLLLAMLALRHIKPLHFAAILLGLLLAVILVAPTYGERIGSLSGVEGLLFEDSEADPDGAILGRTTSNLAALNVFLDYPLLGVGPGMYTPHYSRDYANDLGLRHFTTSRRAHNLYIETAAETGVVGLGAFLATIGTTLLLLWRVRRRWLHLRPELASWATGFGLAIMAYLTTAIFLHLSYQRYFWLLIALANAAIWILSRERSEAEVAAGVPTRQPEEQTGARRASRCS